MRTRLVIEFPSKEALANWVDNLQQHEDLKIDENLKGTGVKFGVYQADGMDYLHADGATYMLKREGARPEQFRMKIVTTETTERTV